MTIRRSLVLLAVACGCAGSATAQTVWWTGGGDGSTWGDPGNWNIAAVPDTNHTVHLGYSDVRQPERRGQRPAGRCDVDAGRGRRASVGTQTVSEAGAVILEGTSTFEISATNVSDRLVISAADVTLGGTLNRPRFPVQLCVLPLA